MAEQLAFQKRGVSAVQSNANSGASRRRLCTWMARATISFPVPLSPVISTELSEGAIRRMSVNTSCIALQHGECLRMSRSDCVVVASRPSRGWGTRAGRRGVSHPAQPPGAGFVQVVSGAFTHGSDRSCDMRIVAQDEDSRRNTFGLDLPQDRQHIERCGVLDEHDDVESTGRSCFTPQAGSSQYWTSSPSWHSRRWRNRPAPRSSAINRILGNMVRAPP